MANVLGPSLASLVQVGPPNRWLARKWCCKASSGLIEWQTSPCRCRAPSARCKHLTYLALLMFAGPDRKLFLPSGLYDRSEIPEYLNGELAGE